MILHRNRNGCSLHGALKILETVDGFVPIVHSSAGCCLQSKLCENFSTAHTGSYFRGILETPCTVIFEKHVIFGGTSRLREQIKNTVQVEKGDLYVVITGCTPEIVGDDTLAMVKEVQEQGFPVIMVSTPGFNGSVYEGYVKTLLEIIIQCITKTQEIHKTDEKLVNILGIVPKQDLFWEGNLLELNHLLTSIGLKSNKLFGFGEMIETWSTIPNAALNLVISPWGLPIAQWLEKKYSIPYLDWGYIPVGINDTVALLQTLGERFAIPQERLYSVLQTETQYFIYRMQQVAPSYIRFNFQKEIALIGETAIILGIGRFLQDSFGQTIVLVVITDQSDKDGQIDILQKANFDKNVEILFSSNQKEIDEKLYKTAPELILGSSLEQEIADKLAIPLIKISAPVHDKLYLQQTYAGCNGAIRLVCDFADVIFQQLISQY
jgi:nitrogenase molybdenum-iron protein beta chain